MYDKDTFQHYAEIFSHLHVKVTFGKRAPHKAIMLLSIIDLVETGVISSSVFQYSQQLESQFRNNWVRYIGFMEGFNCSPSLPFWHLEYEGILNVVLRDDCHKTKKELNDERIYSKPSKMRSVVAYAVLDSRLFELLQDCTVRAKYRVLLISTYCNC